MASDKGAEALAAGERALANGDMIEAKRLFESAARLKNRRATFLLGKLLLRLPGDKVYFGGHDEPKALRLLLKAAETGERDAAILLLRWYLEHSKARVANTRSLDAIITEKAQPQPPAPNLHELATLHAVHPKLTRSFFEGLVNDGWPREVDLLKVGRETRGNGAKIERENKTTEEPRRLPPAASNGDPQSLPPLDLTADGIIIPRGEDFDPPDWDREIATPATPDVLQEIEIDHRGLFTRKGQVVLLYIPDHSKCGDVKTVKRDPESRNRLHATDCRTIDDMKAHQRFERYVVTNRLASPYKAYLRGKKRTSLLDLRICMNCLSRLEHAGYLIAPKAERLHIAQTLDFDRFLEEYGSQFRLTQLPQRRWLDPTPSQARGARL